MFEWIAFGVFVLGALVASMCVSIWRPPRREELEREPGTAFDVSTIAPQIRRVRLSHVAVEHFRPPPASFRKELIAKARRMVTGRSYFLRARSNNESRGVEGSESE